MHGSDQQPEKESCAGIGITPLDLIVTLVFIAVPASHSAEMCVFLNDLASSLRTVPVTHYTYIYTYTLGVGATASLIHAVCARTFRD